MTDVSLIDPNVGLPLPPGQRVRITPREPPSRPVAAAKPTAPSPDMRIRAEDYQQYVPGPPTAPPPREPSATVKAEDYQPWSEEAAAANAPPDRPAIGLPEASAMGVRSALTAGAYPFMKGVAAAIPQVTGQQFFSQANPEYGGLAQPEASMTPQEQAGRQKQLAGEQKTYGETQQPQYEYEQAAKKQHPWGYFGGEVVGGFLGGAAGAARMAAGRTLGTLSNEAIANTLNTAVQQKIGQGAGAAFGRIGSAAGGGASYGAVSGAGETLSSGRNQDLLGNVAMGAEAGALTGGLLGTAGEGVRPIINRALQGTGSKAADRVVGAKVQDIWANAGPITPADVARIRAANPAITPAQLHQQVINDWIARGEVTPQGPITPEMRNAATASGRPLTNLDVGGEAVNRLARQAANTSAEAKGVLRRNLDETFTEQAPRMEASIRHLTGHLDTDAMRARERAANEANYQATYAAGNRPIYNRTLDTILVSDAGQRIIPEALAAIRDEAGARGRIANVDSQRVATGHIMPSTLNIEFWDQFHRALQARQRAALDSRDFTAARRLGQMHEDLLRSLDTEVPEFAHARTNALTDPFRAGQNFVDSRDPDAGRRIINGFLAVHNPAARDLFARGFAEEMASRLRGVGDSQNAIKKLNDIFMTRDARDVMQVALGPVRANQLEALLRVESLRMDKRAVLGNSSSMEQAHAMGHAPGEGGLIAGVIAGGHIFGPGGSAAALVLGNLLRKYTANVNEHTMTEVARLLTSDDAREIARGVQMVAREPALMQGLRTASTAATIGGAREPQPTLSGAYALSQVSPAVVEYFRGKEEHHPHQEMVPAEEAR